MDLGGLDLLQEQEEDRAPPPVVHGRAGQPAAGQIHATPGDDDGDEEGAARRIAARTGPSRPATPPTDARARTSVLASSSWSAPDRVHTDRDIASTTKTKADGRRRSGRPRRATSSPSPATPVDGRGSMEGRGIISLRARHGTLVDH